MGGSVSPLHSYRLCAVADLDNDGRDDLVMAAPNVNQFSSVVIHRGVEGEGVFAAEGERLHWQDNALRTATIRAIKLEVGPAAVIACLNEGAGATCGSPKRLMLNLTEAGFQAAGFEEGNRFFWRPMGTKHAATGKQQPTRMAF